MRKILLLALLCPFLSMCQPTTVKGKILDEQLQPVPSATVTVKGTNAVTISDEKGEFTLPHVFINDTLVVSAVGFETAVEANNERGLITIILKRKSNVLDQAVVMAYGTTTRRLNTGSISKVGSVEIDRQPVSNPLLALEGRIPGLIITQSSGLPGSSVFVQLRGPGSIAQGSEPLFIIDGVPFAPGNAIVNQLSSAYGAPTGSTPGGLSPLNSINPSEIESIEVLKDADATAIYGSRAAGGVILITTKRGRAGKTLVSFQLYAGNSRVTRMIPLLNTEQYVQMRREAFTNDGVLPTIATAPDLLVWDTTRYTDFNKLLTGGTAHTADAELSLSGGTSLIRFSLSGGYHRETTVFPGSTASGRPSFHAGIDYVSTDKKFSAGFTASYSSSVSNIIRADLSASLSLPPNLPSLYDSIGGFAWQYNGTRFENPLAYTKRRYKAIANNLFSNLHIAYRLLKDLTIKTSFGYNTLTVDELSVFPKSSMSPTSVTLASSQFAGNSNKSWIVEPQAEYIIRIEKGKLTALAGGSFQQLSYTGYSIFASGYTNDALLQSLGGAGSITASTAYSQYNYAAAFGRLTYNWESKYIVNLSGRRDGSSRFGPGNQFGLFGAAGAAWIFSSEKFLQKIKFLSFGKLRTSYGSTGNDQIGNYMFLDTWAGNGSYAGNPALVPSRLFNPAYGWEVNKKIEFGLDLGFLNDRILVTADYFRNRSGNQLVQYTLPVQTGFTSVLQNLPAVVQNKGWEFSVTTALLKTAFFQWSLNANLTLAKNKLVAFPGIENSTYNGKYVVGEPLNLLYRYHLLGVDSATGVYAFEDKNKDGALSSADRSVVGSADPKYYGGVGNTFSYKGWELDVFCEFRKQEGQNFLSLTNIPGNMFNQPTQVLDRWQKAGDKTAFQKYTANSFGTPAATAQVTWLPASDGVYSDASFIRVKNISLAYSFSRALLSRLHLESFRFFVQAQNFFTITSFKGPDPETQNYYALPPLKTITAGIHLTF